MNLYPGGLDKYSVLEHVSIHGSQNAWMVVGVRESSRFIGIEQLH